jgi:hypothetical protein
MVNPETLLLGTECVISPNYANNDNFSATLVDFKDTETERFYVFEDCDGDVWDCSIEEIDEVLE